MDKRHYLTFLLFLVYRLSSVIFVQTSYVPDEYWQSLEVAHKMAFGYGYLTWEWRHALRSYFHPFVFFLLYKLLSVLGLDSPVLLITLPKVLQALLTALSDMYFYFLCKTFHFQDYWIKVAVFTNWFWYYCGSRTIVNSFETCLTIIALYYYPWDLFVKGVKDKKNTQEKLWPGIQKKCYKYLTLAVINCLVRPTAATIWLPLILFQWLSLERSFFWKFLYSCLIPVSAITLPISLLIDYLCYGRLVFPALNFLVFNIFKGVSSHYGTHSFHWYLSQGLPVVLGLQYIPFLLGFVFFLMLELTNGRNQNRTAFVILLSTSLLNLLILSSVPHKEFRFILPIMPLMMMMAIKFETEFFVRRKVLQYVWTVILAGGFIVPSAIFGVHHQKGSLQLMDHLRSEAEKTPHSLGSSSFLFLMPCHSTPLYSHLHLNVSTRFLECEPPLEEGQEDESDLFFEDPNKWLNAYWSHIEGSLPPPSHVAFFDDLENRIESFLNSKRYEKRLEILHTVLARRNARRYIYVYERLKERGIPEKDDDNDDDGFT